MIRRVTTLVFGLTALAATGGLRDASATIVVRRGGAHEAVAPAR